MEDTMRDLLSKLDSIVSETALKDKEDLDAKRKALQDLQTDPVASKDPEISKEIIRRKSALEKEAKSKGFTEESDVYEIGDKFGISFSEDFEIGSEIVDILEDGIVIVLDDIAIGILEQNGFLFDEVEINEEKKKGVDGKACWKGYRYAGKEKKSDGSYKDKCVKVGEEVNESGLQYYTGKKKYGKDGMAALAKAGREGASEEELGRIKDKYKKEDQSNYESNASYNMPEGTFHVDTKKEDMIDVKVVDYYYDSYAEDIIIELENAETGEPIKITDVTSGRAEIENWVQQRLEDGKDYSNVFDDLDEAEYQGRKVPLGKPMKGDVKKSKVYVKNAKGNVVKVNFGDKKMRIKKSNPNRRKSFRARHNCDNPGPRWKARYWSCRAW
jgi:hypothetical protein